MRKQKMVKIIHQKGTLCIPADAWAVNRGKMLKKLQTWPLAEWFLKFFHKLDVVYKMDKANPSVPNSDTLWCNEDVFLQEQNT